MLEGGERSTAPHMDHQPAGQVPAPTTRLATRTLTFNNGIAAASHLNSSHLAAFGWSDGSAGVVVSSG
jgi:hypothetical protein